MTLEDDVRTGLHRRAAMISVTPAWDDVTSRVGRGGGPRRSGLVVGAVAVLILAVAGGFLGGRSSVSHPATSTLASAALGKPGASGRHAAGPATNPVSSGAGMLNAPSFAARPIEQALALKRMFIRTTAQGITLRAYSAAGPVPAPYASTSSCGQGARCTYIVGPPFSPCPSGASCLSAIPAPSPSCLPSRTVITEMSDAAAVGQGFSNGAPAASRSVTVLGHGVVGQSEGSAFSWVSVSAGPGVIEATAKFGALGTDRMAVVDGVAVLAVPGGTSHPPASTNSGSPPDTQVQVQGLDTNGHVLSTVVFNSSASSGTYCVPEQIQMAPAQSTPPATSTSSNAG